MAIVWACPLPVETYAAARRDVEVPRPDCPECGAPMRFWHGYFRFVRQGGHLFEVWVRRAGCRSCGITHALLPSFCLLNRLDVTGDVGGAVAEVTTGPVGVRPVAGRLGVPHTTAREWLRRFGARAAELAAAFGALVVELGGAVAALTGTAATRALGAIGAAWWAATALPGWQALGPWPLASCVTGGRLIAANTNMPWLVIGRRRFMVPVP